MGFTYSITATIFVLQKFDSHPPLKCKELTITTKMNSLRADCHMPTQDNVGTLIKFRDHFFN